MDAEPLTSAESHWFLVGDSHVWALESGAAFMTLPCRSLVVVGATAVGMRNPNSATNALEQMRAALIPACPGAIPVLQLGEVDCGFVIWHRAEKLGESVEAQLNASVTAYFGFVDELLAAGYPTVVITGATLPTLRDGELDGEVANLRREVTANQRTRTELTLTYNAALRRGAEVRGLAFIDLADQLMDPATGVIADAWRHPDPKNHHLHPDLGGRLWADRLNAVASTLDAVQATGSAVRDSNRDLKASAIRR